jgi:tRNA A-37 threonylcarbamoyl transferase component Bud32
MGSNKKSTMPNRENGISLAERLTNHVPQALSSAAATFVDSLKINSISEKVRRGRRVVIKRRNVYGEQLADLANLYFRMSGIPIRFWSKAEEWQHWEANCFRMLNGDRFRVSTSGKRTVCMEKLPGKSLWEHMKEGTLTRRMLEAAGTELRRAHQFRSDEFDGPWSHGDSTATNVIYNHKTGRARLIDFEIIHDRSLSAKARHADDLLVFLLDVVAMASSRQWLSFSLSFLNAYGDPVVITELTNHLAVPGGIAWIWWGVRTSFSNPAKVKQRLERIRDVTANLKYYRAFAANRARTRHRRRASINCQVISPGIPSPISLARATRERAKALSPGMPSKLPTTR